jgi:hypothetical protein
MTPQEFKEQLDEFMDKIKELRGVLSLIDKGLNLLDDKLNDNYSLSDNFAMMHCHTRRDMLRERNSIRSSLKEYEKIIQRLKSTL